MNKKKKLSKLHESVSIESLNIIAILESLILNLENCRIACTMLEIAKQKTKKVEKF